MYQVTGFLWTTNSVVGDLQQSRPTTQNLTKLDLLLICAILGCTKGLLAYVNRPVAHCCRSNAQVLALLGWPGQLLCWAHNRGVRAIPRT